MDGIKHCSLLFVAILLTAFVSAQEKEQTTAFDDMYRGFSLHADVLSPLMGRSINSGIATAEVQAEVNLQSKYFPTLEGGYGYVTTMVDDGSHFSSQGPFIRLGLNYNLLKRFDKEGKEKIVRNFPFVGVRYGMSVMSYNIGDVPLSSNYWNEHTSLNYGRPGVYAGWIEIVGGVRVDIYKGLTMGWSVRLKTALHSSAPTSEIWYVPGYGLSGGSAFSFNYTIGYTFRTKKDRQRIESVKYAPEKQLVKTVK